MADLRPCTDTRDEDFLLSVEDFVVSAFAPAGHDGGDTWTTPTEVVVVEHTLSDIEMRTVEDTGGGVCEVHRVCEFVNILFII